MKNPVESGEGKFQGPGGNELWTAYIREFSEHVLARANQNEAMSIDRTGGEKGFLEDALMVACTNPTKFKSELVELIRSLALTSASILFDPVHHGGLYLDRFGEVMVSLGDEIDVDFSRVGEQKLKATPTKVLMLTGPQAGHEKTGNDIDFAPKKALPAGISE